jgi:hypothetical protein
MKSVRVVLDGHRDGDWEIRTSDLPDLVAVVGEDVLAAFCTCFIHADRIVSLVAFFHVSQKRFKKGSIAEHRNFLTFASFLVGTLKELAENLCHLTAVLKERDLLDAASWKKGLGRWQTWGTSGPASTVRKKLSFHVDPELVRDGLRSIASTPEKRVLIKGATGKLRDSAFILGQDASLRGLQLKLGSLNVLGDPAQYLALTDALEDEFIRVLEASGLKPILVRSSGRRVGSGA